MSDLSTYALDPLYIDWNIKVSEFIPFDLKIGMRT